MPKYWIKFIVNECPVCGRGHTYRERQPLPKPDDVNLRYEYHVAYDWCDAL